jgi:hypothetical protein
MNGKINVWAACRGLCASAAIGYEQLVFLFVMRILHGNPFNLEAVAIRHLDNFRAVVVCHQDEPRGASQ